MTNDQLVSATILICNCFSVMCITVILITFIKMGIYNTNYSIQYCDTVAR